MWRITRVALRRGASLSRHSRLRVASTNVRWVSGDASPSAVAAIATGTGVSPPVPLYDASDAVVSVASEASSASALAWYQYGAYYLQDLVGNIHDALGVEWWAAIALATVTVRLAMSPLAVPQLRGTSRLAVIRPLLKQAQEAYQTKRNPTPDDVRQQQAKVWALFQKYQVSPFSGLKFAFMQLPVFYSFYAALRELGARVPAISSGGALWFPDLSAADPYMVLPVLSAATFLLTMELGTEGVTLDPKMRNIFRGMAALMVPLTHAFPSGIFIYWITNSLYAIGQVRFLRLPAVRRFFKILDPSDPNALHKLEMQLRPPRRSRPARSS